MENGIRKSHRKCSVPDCVSPSLAYHRFPYSNPDVFVSWLMKIQNYKLKEMTYGEIHKKARVCDRHFRSEDKNQSARGLKSTAVPMLNLPDNSKQSPDIPDFKCELNPVTDEKICQTCAETSVNFYSINSHLNNSISTVRNMIVLLVPQMENFLHKDDVVCENCRELLMRCAIFVEKCLHVEGDRTNQKVSEDNFNTKNFKCEETPSVAEAFGDEIISDINPYNQFEESNSSLIEDSRPDIFDRVMDTNEHQIIPDHGSDIPQTGRVKELPNRVLYNNRLISVGPFAPEQLNSFTNILTSNNVETYQFFWNSGQNSGSKRIILVGSAFKCQRCSLDLNNKYSYARHLNCHKKWDRIRIEKDKLKKLKMETNEAEVQVAPTRKHQSKRKVNLVCKTCSKRFSSRDEQEAHLKLHPPYICEKCGKGFSTSSSLAVHKEVHNDPNTFICEVCGKGYRFQAALRVHRRLHENKIHMCYKCGKVFNSDLYLRKHLTYTHSEGLSVLHSCKECGKVFKESCTLNSHYRVMHLKDDAYACELCGKRFCRADYLRRHMRRHTIIDKKPRPRSNRKYLAYDKKYVAVEGGYQCPICEKVLKSKFYLKSHILGHGSLSRFSCKYCDMTFKIKFQRNNHEKLHENSDLKYRCGTCWKRFKFEEELDKHSIIHTNLKYKCEMCDQSFARKYLLADHFVKNHVDDKDIKEESRALLRAAGFKSRNQNDVDS